MLIIISIMISFKFWRQPWLRQIKRQVYASDRGRKLKPNNLKGQRKVLKLVEVPPSLNSNPHFLTSNSSTISRLN